MDRSYLALMHLSTSAERRKDRESTWNLIEISFFPIFPKRSIHLTIINQIHFSCVLCILPPDSVILEKNFLNQLLIKVCVI